MIIDLVVNGKACRLNARSSDRLVDLLRRDLGLKSLLPDCLSGICGRCLIMLDGRLVHACMLPAFKARGATIFSFEGLAHTDDIREIEQALQDANATPCAFCRRAKVMAINDLLSRTALPDKNQILEQLDLVHCACTDPETLSKAVNLAAAFRNKRKFNRADK
jgi:carbon-monoxide dehydrogenase small subunit